MGCDELLTTFSGPQQVPFNDMPRCAGYPDFMQCTDDPEDGLQFNTLGELGGIYSMDVYEERAKNIIENHPDDVPLFLYLAQQAPHYPYYAPLRYMDTDCVGDDR